MAGVSQVTRKLTTGYIGFTIEETMSGHHQFRNDYGPPGEHPIEFTLRWGPSNLFSWINPLSRDFFRHPVEGTVTVGHLCDGAPAEGFMELRYVTERKIRYVFDFSVDGDYYHFHGEKSNLRLNNLHRTHTTLTGQITNRDKNELVSEAELYFYWSSLPSMLTSFRLT